MNEPSVLTRMRLSCCWGDNLNEKELNEVVNYISHLQQENQQLKLMICPIYEKCQKGECDCTHEEYNSMCERNMKMSVELNEYKDIINEVREYIKKNVNRDVNYLNDDCIYSEWVIKEPEKLLEILNKVGDCNE